MVKRPSKKTKSRESEEEKGHKKMGYPECGACAELNTRMYIGKREWKGDCNQPTLNSRIIDLIDLWFRLTMTMRERALSVCEWGIRKAGYRMWWQEVEAISDIVQLNFHSVYPYPGVIVLFSRATHQILTHARTHSFERLHALHHQCFCWLARPHNNSFHFILFVVIYRQSLLCLRIYPKVFAI